MFSSSKSYCEAFSPGIFHRNVTQQDGQQSRHGRLHELWERRYDSVCQESAIPLQPKVHGAVLRSP
jgi:hypothetical protein